MNAENEDSAAIWGDSAATPGDSAATPGDSAATPVNPAVPPLNSPDSKSEKSPAQPFDMKTVIPKESIQPVVSAIVGDDYHCSLEFEIKNKLGLHARPSARFVKITNRFQAEIWVEKDGEQINGKSIMGLMMLAAGQGTKLKILAEGPDAKLALQELENLAESKFEED